MDKYIKLSWLIRKVVPFWLWTLDYENVLYHVLVKKKDRRLIAKYLYSSQYYRYKVQEITNIENLSIDSLEKYLNKVFEDISKKGIKEGGV